MLQQRFEDFLHDLFTNEERVTSVLGLAKVMVDNGHFETAGIQARVKDIEAQWEELKEISQARQDVSSECEPCFFNSIYVIEIKFSIHTD